MKSTPKQTVLLIDGDPIRYRTGFAAETPVFDVIAEWNAPGNAMRLRFERTPNQTALQNFQQWKKHNASATILDCVKTIKAETDEHVRQMACMHINSVIKEVREHVKIDRRDLRVDIYLSEGSNYRDTLAMLKPYKGSRDKQHRPVHYKTVEKELRDKYHVIDAIGHEADDAVSIAAWRMRKDGQRFVIATIDKDLDQIPGLHYDYLKKVFYEQSKPDSRRWFWQQVLSGDATDNIGGACKIGLKRAEALVSAWESDRLMATSHSESYDQRMWRGVLEVYANSQRMAACYYADKADTDAVALENARLVYLQQEHGELWTPPNHPKQFMRLEE